MTRRPAERVQRGRRALCGRRMAPDAYARLRSDVREAQGAWAALPVGVGRSMIADFISSASARLRRAVEASDRHDTHARAAVARPASVRRMPRARARSRRVRRAVRRASTASNGSSSDGPPAPPKRPMGRRHIETVTPRISRKGRGCSFLCRRPFSLPPTSERRHGGAIAWCGRSAHLLACLRSSFSFSIEAS